MSNKRTCGNCRWWLDEKDGAGQCRQDTPTVNVIGPKYPTWPVTDDSHWCGKWRDKSITPEQEQRAELVTRFALAIVSDCDATTGDRWEPDAVWRFAAEYVDARPKIGGEA